MSEQPVDPNEQDQHAVSTEDGSTEDGSTEQGPAKRHGDLLEDVVTDSAEMRDEQ